MPKKNNRTTIPPEVQALFLRIADYQLGVDHFDTRNTAEDFRSCHVASIRAALWMAFEAGTKAGRAGAAS